MAFLTSRHSVFSNFLLLAVLLWGISVNGQQPTTNQQQQRPRRVGESESKPNTAPANSALEEGSEGDTVRVETQLVSVPAVVINGMGHPMAGLRQENFVLYEDGQKQTLTNFGTTEAPFEIALLLDTSGSTREDVGLIRQAANAFVDALRAGDRVAIVAFNNVTRAGQPFATVEVLTSLTDDRRVLHQAMERIGSSNGTPFYDSLQKIADQIFRDPPRDEVRGRRAIVALTDGVDSSSDSDFAATRARLSRTGVATYFIEVNTEDFVEERLLRDCRDDGQLTLSPKQLQRYREVFLRGAKADTVGDFCQMGQFERMAISQDLYNLARREMDELARYSGGRNFTAATLQDARAAFRLVAAEIGTQYSLGYYPTNKARDGKYRAIRVEVRGVTGKADVRAREGYYAPKS